MSVIAENVPRRPPPAFLTQGFRPFFLAAGLWAVVALGLWIAIFVTGAGLPSRFDPLSWHIHEMLFGFVMAAIAGFLLTAVPNWTRRLPVSGGRLALLAGLWLVGRTRLPGVDTRPDLARGRGRSDVSRDAGRDRRP